MIAKLRTLVDHEEIRRWARERGATPSLGRRTHEDDSIGVIGLDFPGSRVPDSLEEISWDEWFRNFDENDLALIVEGEMANGQSSNFHKLAARENLEESSGGTSTRGGEKKAPSRTRITARPTMTEGSRETSVGSKPNNQSHNREQHSKRSASGHKPRRKAA